jgi:DNA-binding NtrC family response regulator
MDIPAKSGSSPDHLDEFARFLRDSTLEGGRASSSRTLKAWLDLAEAYRITQALRDCHGNRSAAARTLGIGRRTLYAKMDKLGITATWRVAS